MVIGLVGLVPLYWWGAKYYVDCGHPLSKLSVAYLLNQPAAEWLVTILWLVHVLFYLMLANRMPRPQKAIILSSSRSQTLNTSGILSRVKIVLAWLGWTAITAVLSLPTALYAASATIPDDDVFKGDSRSWLETFHVLAPALTLMVDRLLIPPVSKVYAKRSGLRLSMLKTTARMASMWVVATGVTILLHENCIGGWKWFWRVCNDESSADPFKVSVGGLEILNPKDDLCRTRPDWFMRSRCSRSVVETLTPLFLGKTALRATVQPVMSICLWRLSKRTEVGELKLRGLGLRTTGSISPTSQYSTLLTLCEFAFVWGPLVPLLYPLIWAALGSQIFAYKVAILHFDAVPKVDTSANLSRAHFLSAVGISVAFMVWVSTAGNFHGQPLLIAITACFVLRALGVGRLAERRTAFDAPSFISPSMDAKGIELCNMVQTRASQT